jgi:hypothetical protein
VQSKWHKDWRTDLCEFFVEALDETSKNVARIRDLLGILANDPDQAASRIRVVQIVNTLTKC